MIKKTGRERRFMITKNLILLLVFFAIIALAIWAWFTMNREVNASGISITSSAADDVQIAHAKSDGTLDTDFSYELVINDDFEFVNDCTGDGRSFIIPAFSITQNAAEGKQVNLNAESVEAITSKNAVEDQQYQVLSIDFFLRSRNKNIQVKQKSYLAGLCEAVDAVSLTSNKRESDYGSFSADALVQSMRVSLIGTPVTEITNGVYITGKGESPPYIDTGDSRQFLWIPRSDYQLHASTESTKNWELNPVTTNISSLSPSYYPETYKHFYYSAIPQSQDTDAGVVKETMLEGDDLSISYGNSQEFTANGNTVSIPTLRYNKNITTFTNAAQSIALDGNNYYIYKYTLNLWIEGSDSEARRAMNGGKFRLHLEFGNG